MRKVLLLVPVLLVACGEAADTTVPPPVEEPPPIEEPPPPPPPTVDATGLVAYFPFDGDARDASGRGHDGVVLGATPVTDRHGEAGAAMSFDGIADGVVVPDSVDFDLTEGDFTIAFWARTSTNGLASFIGHASSRERAGWLVGTEDGTPALYVDDDFRFSDEVELPVDEWTHLSFVKSGTTLALVADDTTHYLGELDKPARPALTELRIGFAAIHGVDAALQGALDDVVIFSRALDRTELAVLRDGGAPSLADTQSAAAEPPLDTELVWTTCPLISANPNSLAVECTDAEVALDPNDPSAGRHPYFVKRVPAQGEPLAQLWLLSGGPGYSGESLESVAFWLRQRAPNLEIYLPDHRGLGRSDAMHCYAQEAQSSEAGPAITEAELEACIASLERVHGRRLPHVSMSAHARDLGATIEVVRRPNVPVFVYGLSYGGRLAFRYLELFPTQADGVILDSPALPGHFVTEQVEWVDEAGAKLMQMCADDVDCAAKFGGRDPLAVTRSLLERIDQGHCSELGTDRLQLSRLLGGTLLTGWAVRALAPAIVYRADRCDAGDVAALRRLIDIAFPDAPNPPAADFTTLLHYHVLLSDLWPANPLSAAEYEAAERALTFTSGGNAILTEIHAVWPRNVPEHDNTWPALEVPMLVLQSDIDPNTGPSEIPELVSQFTRNDQQVVMFPQSNHVVVGHSRTADSDSCGLDLIAAFIADPTGTLDTSCAAENIPQDFEANPALNLQLFGTADRWENE